MTRLHRAMWAANAQHLLLAPRLAIAALVSIIGPGFRGRTAVRTSELSHQISKEEMSTKEPLARSPNYGIVARRRVQRGPRSRRS